MKDLIIGSDPEFVLLDEKTGKPVAAPIAMKSGSQVKEVKTRFGRFFPDNVNLEVATEPAKTKQEFLGNLEGVIKMANKAVPGYTLHAIPSMDFPVDQLQHEICQRFACDPDFDAFEMCQNEIDPEAVEQTFRTAGGHVHMGYTKGHDYLQDPFGRIDAVKRFEAIVGLPALLLDGSPESIRRRELYGAAGAHRPKEYGVEARSLSNFWTQTPELASFVWDATQLAGRETAEGNLKGFNYDQLPRIINAGDTVKAQETLSVIQDTYPELKALHESVMEQANLDKSIPLTTTWNL